MDMEYGGLTITSRFLGTLVQEHPDKRWTWAGGTQSWKHIFVLFALPWRPPSGSWVEESGAQGGGNRAIVSPNPPPSLKSPHASHIF